MNPEYMRGFDNCLLLACKDNPNINIIKYLIEDKKIDLNYRNYSMGNYFEVACYYNNTNIVKYLIEIIQMNINVIYINNVTSENLNFLKKSGYINFIKYCKHVRDKKIKEIIDYDKFSDENIELLLII